MKTPAPCFDMKSDPGFKVFHELMLQKVTEILLVSSAYDAFILEEDGSIASRIIHEYHGLNLSKPPRLTSVSTGKEALALLANKKYDLVITTPYVGDMDAFALGCKIKEFNPELPVILLTSNLQYASPSSDKINCQSVDNLYLWTGNTDLFLAIIKNTEDHLNVRHDTEVAMVRILILVEDSPEFRSRILPILYKVVVKQTQTVLDESLNEEHRILKMRARPKILVASSYEEALGIYERYNEYVFGIVSDTKYFQNSILEDEAGIKLLSYVRRKDKYLPLLLMSSNPTNRKKGEAIPAVFIDKNIPNLRKEIESFFLTNLGFGDFVFRMPDGCEVARAKNLHSFEKILSDLPEESFLYHAENNHFSSWIMARSEIGLASWVSDQKSSDFSSVDLAREHLLKSIHGLRECRQKGVVVSFSKPDYDPEIMDFVKIGSGSMGGKARGIAFMSSEMQRLSERFEKFSDVSIKIPKTCVILEDAYNDFIEQNELFYVRGGTDNIISERFLDSELPGWLIDELRSFLKKVTYPLAIRSSSLLEDALFRPYAGLYKTCMLPNNDSNFEVRFYELMCAIKLVYASSYFEGPRSYSKSFDQNRKDSMAVIIQQLVGKVHGDYYYPAISGVAQSYNYYPISRMKPEEGITHIALGFGRTVVEGECNLRFSPSYPQIVPQFANVDDILKNSQKYFYALNYKDSPNFENAEESLLTKREILDAKDEHPVEMLTSTYIPAEHRIRDINTEGSKVLTFSQLLKNNIFNIADIIKAFLEIGREGMGCQVEIEFSANLAADGKKAEFNFLQIRPMVAGEERFEISITEKEKELSFCYSKLALGHGKINDLTDIILVKDKSFKTTITREIAGEISQLNALLQQKDDKYLLIGPGRWGSADRLLGVPVKWQDISNVGVIVELRNKNLSVEPSQGTHFFQNITSLGIPYLTVNEKASTDDLINWECLNNLTCINETKYLKHLKTDTPFTVKNDARKSEAVVVL